MVSLLALLVAASPAEADFTTFCGSTIEQVQTDEFPKKLKREETRQLWRSIWNVNPAEQGTLLRADAARAGVATCRLADLLDAQAGVDPVSGCQKGSDLCTPNGFDAAFAAAFEKRPDRASKRVMVHLLAGAPLVIPAGLKSVTRLGITADDGTLDLAPVAGLPGLKALSLDRMSVSGFAPLSKLTQLESLAVTHTHVSGPLDFGFVGKLPALREIEVSLSKQDVGAVTSLAPLAALKNLEALVLVGVRAGDCAPVAKLAKLKKLTLPGRVKGESKAIFGTVVQFEETGGDASCVAGLTGLESLSLTGFGITDLKPVARLTKLTELGLAWNRALVDLRPLAGLTALRTLELSHTQVADLTPLQGMTALTTLELTNCPVANLTPIQHLPQVNQLMLRGTKVKSLAPLHGWKQLYSIYLPDVSAEERAALQAQVPRAQLQR